MTMFSGQHRLEHSTLLGRAIRVGSPAEMEVSDLERLLDALNRSPAEGQEYLDYLHPLYVAMLRGAGEWVLQWLLFIAESLKAQEIGILNQVLDNWSAGLIATRHLHPTDAIKFVKKLMEPQKLSSAERTSAEVLQPLITPLEQKYDALKSLLVYGEATNISEGLKNYVADARGRHDLLIRALWHLPIAVRDIADQQWAEAGLKQSFESCSFHKVMWNLFSSLPSDIRAAFLAEHLRVHFSGENRNGSVRIVEESDCYRLIVNPCGSGGTLRRQQNSSAALFMQASPVTFKRTAVPAYCAHCALNEIYSTQHFGRALWTTQFNTDPAQPCSWVIPKESDATEHYSDNAPLKREEIQCRR